jgi:CCR4-NOT transcription complex subunit 9
MNQQPILNPTQQQQGSVTTPMERVQQDRFHALVADLLIPDKREHALTELSKNRELYPQLAPTLWHSVGVMTALLQV